MSPSFDPDPMNLRNGVVLFLSLFWAQLIMAALAMLWGHWFIGIVFTLLSLAIAAFFTSTAYSVLFGAPFVPMDHAGVAEMIRVAGVGPGQRLYDLGSGDGRILIAAAKAGAHAEGWEVSPFLWLYSRWNIKRQGVADRATVHFGSYWDSSMKDADVITLFLVTIQMGRMEKKLQAELRPGSKVASYAFSFPNWKESVRSGAVHLYRKE